ncbi:MmcQ/YjbR family DNA-binding protein [Flavobacterium selenitireducens]|uniref:MmcQ/YjbR family DNA-binding protein n=1 Tax=Flavobacterium selenitireducens TaxID=2722704 RepID=UPI00168A9B2A|nr:MmcQ/YjbR family DNA-binding protein [Flavobacterium selenitireducens]MBD3581880.1 hypothetical protein [Flavobacterium selenitireducens]
MTLETLETICSAMPHAHEEIKWKSDLVFMVASKMFCLVDLESVPMSVAFKVPDDRFDEISTQPNFKPAPYFAQHKWVTIIDIGKVSSEEFERHVKTSYELVKSKLTKKIREGLTQNL